MSDTIHTSEDDANVGIIGEILVASEFNRGVASLSHVRFFFLKDQVEDLLLF